MHCNSLALVRQWGYCLFVVDTCPGFKDGAFTFHLHVAGTGSGVTVSHGDEGGHLIPVVRLQPELRLGVMSIGMHADRLSGSQMFHASEKSRFAAFHLELGLIPHLSI